MQKPRPLVSGHDFARYLTPSGRLDVDRLVNEFRGNSQDYLSTSSESGSVGVGSPHLLGGGGKAKSVRLRSSQLSYISSDRRFRSGTDCLI